MPTNAAEAIATLHTCQCGCNKPIPFLKRHKWRQPRYLRSHAQRAPEFKKKWSASIAARYERPPDAPVHICQCGCGEPITWRPAHRSRIPLFIQAHYLRDGGTKRVAKLREAKLRSRLQPPVGWVSSGLCQCGCGETTRIATSSKPERGEYIGHPRRFLHGHYGRWLLSQRGPNHPRWSGGRIGDKAGYIRVWMPEYPGANRDGHVLEHRYVYEQTRGVTLPSTIQVHHINGIKSDNRPENLVATSRPAHVKAHIKAGEVLAMFWDKRLLRAAEEHFDAHHELPDIEALTAEIYAHADTPTF